MRMMDYFTSVFKDFVFYFNQFEGRYCSPENWFNMFNIYSLTLKKKMKMNKMLYYMREVKFKLVFNLFQKTTLINYGFINN